MGAYTRQRGDEMAAFLLDVRLALNDTKGTDLNARIAQLRSK